VLSPSWSRWRGHVAPVTSLGAYPGHALVRSYDPASVRNYLLLAPPFLLFTPKAAAAPGLLAGNHPAVKRTAGRPGHGQGSCR
jgi:hypothetical protein